MATTEIRERADIENMPIRRYDDVATTRRFSRISWASVLAGSAVGLVFQMWLSMLGVAIGASTIDPLKEAQPLSGLGIGSLVWLGASIIISSYLGGWIAGRFAGASTRAETTVHGMVSWAVSNWVAFMLLGTVFGAAVAGTGKLVATTASAAGNAATSIADNASTTANTPNANTPNATAANANANPNASNATASNGNSNAVDQAINDLKQSANSVINRGQAAVQSGQAEATARQAGDTAAKSVAATGWGLVILMFLGLGAGMWGASMATPTYSVSNRFRS